MSELPDDVSSVPENRAYLKVTNCRDARPHVPTDQERTGTPPGRQERAKQWRQAVTNCKSYLSPVVLDWDGPTPFDWIIKLCCVSCRVCGWACAKG